MPEGGQDLPDQAASAGGAEPGPSVSPLDAIPFRQLNVHDEICAALEDTGIRTAFPIQALALPIALDGSDIIGQARTGTGKTLAFGIPLLQRLTGADRVPQALIIVPTRELAIQVADDLRIAGARLGTRVLTVYGGRAYEPQIESLK
ncbi:MAG: DEAD/DEAH box helicase, partial [Kitasatospora sp.]|nr:DEAD/DEAH box helicase [Kitasatospora sp.]